MYVCLPAGAETTAAEGAEPAAEGAEPAAEGAEPAAEGAEPAAEGEPKVEGGATAEQTEGADTTSKPSSAASHSQGSSPDQ